MCVAAACPSLRKLLQLKKRRVRNHNAGRTTGITKNRVGNPGGRGSALGGTGTGEEDVAGASPREGQEGEFVYKVSQAAGLMLALHVALLCVVGCGLRDNLVLTMLERNHMGRVRHVPKTHTHGRQFFPWTEHVAPSIRLMLGRSVGRPRQLDRHSVILARSLEYQPYKHASHALASVASSQILWVRLVGTVVETAMIPPQRKTLYPSQNVVKCYILTTMFADVTHHPLPSR